MNNITVLNFVEYFFEGFIFIPIITAIYGWKNLTISDKYVFCFLLSSISIEVISEILRFSRVRNHFLAYPQTVFVLVFSFQFFKIQYSKETNKINQLLYFIILLIPLEVIFISGFNQFNVITRTISIISLIIFSIIYLIKLVLDTSFKYRNALFFHNLGFLIIGLFSIIPSVFDRYFIETSLDLFYFFDTLKFLGLAFAFIMFSVGFWFTQKN
jgi:hypothetical protein